MTSTNLIELDINNFENEPIAPHHIISDIPSFLLSRWLSFNTTPKNEFGLLFFWSGTPFIHAHLLPTGVPTVG